MAATSFAKRAQPLDPDVVSSWPMSGRFPAGKLCGGTTRLATRVRDGNPVRSRGARSLGARLARNGAAAPPRARPPQQPLPASAAASRGPAGELREQQADQGKDGGEGAYPGIHDVHCRPCSGWQAQASPCAASSSSFRIPHLRAGRPAAHWARRAFSWRSKARIDLSRALTRPSCSSTSRSTSPQSARGWPTK